MDPLYSALTLLTEQHGYSINKVLQVQRTPKTAGIGTSEPVGLGSAVSRQAQWQDWWGHRVSESCETMEVFPGQADHGVLGSCDLFKENSNNFVQLYKLTVI